MIAPKLHNTDAACLAKLLAHGNAARLYVFMFSWRWSLLRVNRLARLGLIDLFSLNNTISYRLTPDGLAIAQAHKAATQAVGGA